VGKGSLCELECRDLFCRFRLSKPVKADCFGEELQLCYLRNKDGREIDFLVTRNSTPELMIEVKWSDEKLSGNFKIFEKFLLKVRSMPIRLAQVNDLDFFLRKTDILEII
jgi:hypothetical protein